MKNPVNWFEIYVDDIKRAQTFYQALLNIEFSDLSDPSDDSIIMKAFPSVMEEYGITGALVKMEGVSAGQNSVMVYFACDDCAVEESRVESAGGKVIRPKFDIGEFGFISIITDTEGNTVGLHSRQ